MRRFAIPVLLVFVPIFAGIWLWLEVLAVQIPLSLEVQTPRFVQIDASDLNQEVMKALPKISSQNHAHFLEVLGNVKKEQEVTNRVIVALGLVIAALVLALLSLLYKTPRDIADSPEDTVSIIGPSLSWRDASIVAWGLAWRMTAVLIVPSIAMEAFERTLNTHDISLNYAFLAADFALGILAMIISVKWLFRSTKVVTS